MTRSTHSVTVRPVRDEASYEEAVREVEALWGAEPGTPDADRLDVLMTLVTAYEDKHHAIAFPDPIEAIKTRVEDLGLSRADLEKMLGVSSGRVSEILNRRRALTLEMIRILAARLSLPEACLIQPYDLEKPGRALARERVAKRVAKKLPASKAVAAKVLAAAKSKPQKPILKKRPQVKPRPPSRQHAA